MPSRKTEDIGLMSALKRKSSTSTKHAGGPDAYGAESEQMEMNIHKCPPKPVPGNSSQAGSFLGAINGGFGVGTRTTSTMAQNIEESHHLGQWVIVEATENLPPQKNFSKKINDKSGPTSADIKLDHAYIVRKRRDCLGCLESSGIRIAKNAGNIKRQLDGSGKICSQMRIKQGRYSSRPSSHYLLRQVVSISDSD